jgi:N-acetylmuramoyl-L-alanine amidase
MPLRRVWQPSPNTNGRGGQAVRLIIVHTAEGALTHEALGNFFKSSSSGVSSHVGIDDKLGEVGEYAKTDRATWTAGAANPYSVQAELCAFARWDPAEWSRHPNMLQNTAQWIAEEAARFGIPIVKSSSRGVCGHVDVSGPGGHWDPGPSFPWDRVLAMALSGVAEAPGQPTQGGTNMMITNPGPDGGYWMLDAKGGVFAKGAPFHGSVPGVPAVPSAPIIGGTATPDGGGYWLVGRDGSVYAFGNAQYQGPAPKYRQDWGIGTGENPVVGIATTKRHGIATYALAAARAGQDPADYVMEPDGRYAA